jgi:NADH-quinone oxidoreductase subunit F
VKAIFPGASDTVLTASEPDVPMDFDSMREVGSGLGSGGFAVFDDSACMVKAAHLYSRFLYVESCGQCPACKFGTGEVTKLLEEVESDGASDRTIESILMRARGSTDGQKCALPTGESLLMQSLYRCSGRSSRTILTGCVHSPGSSRPTRSLIGIPRRAASAMTGMS